jgi:uncharacterized membrane protein
MTTKSATEQYAAIKVNHVKYLDELKIVDANLVRIRPLLEAEKGFNKLNGTKINFIKEEFRVAKVRYVPVLMQNVILLLKVQEAKKLHVTQV